MFQSDNMTPEFCAEIAKDNVEAVNFIMRWLQHIHHVDDIIDESPEPEQVIEAFVNATMLFGSDPFYRANWNVLYPINLLAANAYADSVSWQTSSDWRALFSDVLRSYGNEMLLMVAYLVGGWKHMRKISPKLRELSYNNHHTSEGAKI